MSSAGGGDGRPWEDTGERAARFEGQTVQEIWHCSSFCIFVKNNQGGNQFKKISRQKTSWFEGEAVKRSQLNSIG